VKERIRVPAPALFLTVAAIAVWLVPELKMHEHPVQRIVTIALVCILFNGGMHIGWSRFRASAVPITVVGVLGTFLTVAAAALLANAAFGFSWYLALLLGTAVAPTDPAVVFSVLGNREVSGRSGTIIEGESGANDPVGIALMASLVSAGGLSAGAFGDVASEFALQMVVGAVVGLLVGRALLWFLRSVRLPRGWLYPLCTFVVALLLFGLATVAQGSGFLAVFIAGILIGDEQSPRLRDIERFQSVLAGLGEIVAFLVLGLTVDLGLLTRADVWVPGLVLAVVLAVVIRPVLVGLCLLPARLGHNERAFVLFAGLKGAVPILLGSYVLAEHLPEAGRVYGIIIVVVAFSVIVQGSLVPTVARLLRVPMRTVEPPTHPGGPGGAH
jgi:cell volume regulation protein A